MCDAEERHFTAETGDLRDLSAWCRAWAAAAGLSRDGSFGVELCLNEAVTNVVQHGAADKATVAIDVRLETCVGGVRMVIADNAAAFNPIEYPIRPLPPSLADMRTGGLGILLIRTYAHMVDYRREGDRNVLMLTFERENRRRAPVD